jgi:hypothetical protein
LRILKPSFRDTIEENEKLIQKELYVAALLISISSLYGLIVTCCSLFGGISIGLDARTLLGLVVLAWAASFGNVPGDSDFTMLNVAENTTSTGSFFSFFFFFVFFKIHFKM